MLKSKSKVEKKTETTKANKKSGQKKQKQNESSLKKHTQWKKEKIYIIEIIIC